MKIGIFTVAPLFPRLVHGGSTKTLETVATYLGKLGHECIILCTRRPDSNTPFHLGKNVMVKPILRFKPTYPEPYYTAPYDLASVILTTRALLEDSDVFYIHDAELKYHFIYDDIPTIMACQDFVYPDTLSGILSFRRDRLLVTSEYIRRCLQAILDLWLPLKEEDLRVVPNGFNVDFFRRLPVSDPRLDKFLGLREEIIPILYPHRPDPRKGIFECLDVISRLRQLIPARKMEKVRLLIPIWMDSHVVPESEHVYQGLYGSVMSRSKELGIEKAPFFHQWVPTNLMPAYYSFGKATMCIGNFIEAFGNCSVESELCGTPSLISRVGAQRDILPEGLCRKVDFGDLETAAHILAEILMEPEPEIEEVRDFIGAQYSENSMLDGYVEALTTTVAREPLPLNFHHDIRTDDVISTPPWCAITKSGLYNDYAYGYFKDARLIEIIQKVLPKTVQELASIGVSAEDIREWVAQGVLLRKSKRGRDNRRSSILSSV